MNHAAIIACLAWLLFVLPLPGCSLLPVIPVLGAASPGWFFCLLGGVFLLILCHILITCEGWQPCFFPLVFSYVALMLLSAMLLWSLFFVHRSLMTTSRTLLLHKEWPLLVLVLAAILALILVIWQLQTSPEISDTYVYADIIDVVSEVSGRTVEMPIRDNQRVKKGDLLFRIDLRPYQTMLDDTRVQLTTLDAQIMLTQRTIKVQEYNAQPVAVAVERARALVKQTISTRTRLELLVPQGFVSQEDLDQARTAEKAARAELEATLLQVRRASAAATGMDTMVAQRTGILTQIALIELHLEFTEVRTPFNDAVVALRTIAGQYALALKPVFTLLDDDCRYVIANFRETDLDNVHPGMTARIAVMTNHNRTFNGVVDSVDSEVLSKGESVIERLSLIQKSIN